MNKHMDKVIKSRTFWTIVAMFVIGGGNAVVPMIPVGLQAIAIGGLGILATYFHVNPAQSYNGSTLDK